jgi:hypothetical protein
VGSFELGYLTFRFVASNSVALLKFPDELIALPFDHLSIIVGQSAPLLLCISDQLLPVSFDLIAVYLRLGAVNASLPTAPGCSSSLPGHAPQVASALTEHSARAGRR